MTDSSDADAPSAGGTPFLQKRLALFAATLAGISLLGCAAQFMSIRPGVVGSLPFALMLAMTVSDFALFALMRGPARSTGALRLVEALFLLWVAVLTGLIAHAVPIANMALREAEDVYTGEQFFVDLGASGSFAYVVMCCVLASTQTYALRAALVPSSSRRTLALTVLGGFVLALVSSVPLSGWAPDEALRAAIRWEALLAINIGIVIWWVMTTIICVVISHVIHGLRREVRSAKRLGQYQLEAKLGEGGMGIVYRAQHALLRRPTAVKLLPPEKVGETSIKRFEREVRLTATLTHPNTVTIYDYGRTPDGVFYYAMELLDGAPLDRIVAHDGPQPPARAVHVLRSMAGALREAHGRGLIHRDVKPGNIVLCDNGGERDVPMLLDFGLVKPLDGAEDAALTHEKTITGTPLYLAPEVIRSANAAGPASDLYALGAVAYYLVTGQHVFDGANVVEICSHHLQSEPEPPSERLGQELPPDLEALILDLLAKDPNDRPGTADALLERLDALDVPAWSRVQGETWWETHGPALRDASAPVDARADTLMIDVGQRS